MSTLLRAKRSLEALAGPVRFDRGDDGETLRVLDQHGEWLGETREEWLIAAIDDAHETLRVRDRLDAAECAGDYRDAMRRDGDL